MDFGLSVEVDFPKPARVDFLEQRREFRFNAARAAIVTALDRTAEGLSAGILDLSSSGMKLTLSRPVEAGTPVRIDIETDLILGEIRYCIREESGSYTVGIEMDQVLRNANKIPCEWAAA